MIDEITKNASNVHRWGHFNWLGQGPVFGRSFSSSEKWSPNTKKPPAMRVVGNALAYRKKPPMIQYM